MSSSRGSDSSSSSYTKPLSLITDLQSPIQSSSNASVISTTSSGYRHHTAPFLPLTPLATPKSKLYKDAKHTPKTRGSAGILVVGLGGDSSKCMVAGILANRLDLTWKGPRGEPRDANYNACLTQEENKIKGLASVSMAAIGGWDISPTKLGDSLMDAHILDYDLTRQVKDEMNKMKIFRGCYEQEYHSNDGMEATHVLSPKEAPNSSESLKCLRADVRYFKWRNGVVGHTTVIWNATPERPSDFVHEIKTARDLLNSVENNETTLPPSILYATAALLEGCSFVEATESCNAANCPGLVDLARQQVGVYCCFGKGFSGPAQLEASVESCLQSIMGMTDINKLEASFESKKKPIEMTREKESSNDGDTQSDQQNDMFDDGGTSHIMSHRATTDGQEIVEYTSLGFLGQVHSVTMHTRASKPLLQAPLLIDVAVWCDYFSNRSWPHDKVSKALAYLFVSSENHENSLQELQSQALAASEDKKKPRSSVKKRVRIRPEEKTTEWAIPHDARILCAGLACVDMQLNQATGGDGGESIETFEGSKSIGGGSVSMACKTLARLCHGEPLDDDYMQVTPPVVHSVVPLCKIGNDDSGNKLLSLLEECGGSCRNVETKHVRRARMHDSQTRTALSVLPIYRDGRRGCYFDAASNATFSQSDMTDLLHSLTPGATGPSLDLSQLSEDDFDLYKERVLETTPVYGAFLFGYPHLLPMMQGGALANIFQEARAVMEEGGIVALDLNGVPEKTISSLRTVSELGKDSVIGAALEYVDILHMNEDELVLLTGCEIDGTAESQLEDDFSIAGAVNLFLSCGVAIVAVTRGKKGSFVSCNNSDRFRESPLLPSSWTDCTANIAAVELPPDTVINTNGAGDSFTSGLLVASMLRHTGMSVPVRKDTENENEVESDGDESLELDDLGPKTPPSPRISSPTKTKMSPYTLYMRENYVTLKQQLNDDKKAIFSRCHEMWENETEEVKALYERRAMEEIEEQNDASVRLDNDMEALDSTPRNETPSFSSTDGGDDAQIRNLYMTNRALNLESAVQFASLVAAHHIDVGTRDLMHLDMSPLLERAMIFPHGLEEI